ERGWRMEDGGWREERTRAPRLSAAVMIVRAPGESAAASMARETLSGERSVMAQIVEPEPLRNAPSAPADSAAAITSSMKGMSFLRKGWCKRSAKAPRSCSYSREAKAAVMAQAFWQFS